MMHCQKNIKLVKYIFRICRFFSQNKHRIFMQMNSCGRTFSVARHCTVFLCANIERNSTSKFMHVRLSSCKQCIKMGSKDFWYKHQTLK
jgi:hypothetical protein